MTDPCSVRVSMSLTAYAPEGTEEFTHLSLHITQVSLLFITITDFNQTIVDERQTRIIPFNASNFDSVR